MVDVEINRVFPLLLSVRRKGKLQGCSSSGEVVGWNLAMSWL